MSGNAAPAHVAAVRLGAAHDGEAELLLTLRFPNGGSAPVALDHHAARHLVEACGAATPDALIGASWERVRDALAAASSRFLATPPASQTASEPRGESHA